MWLSCKAELGRGRERGAWYMRLTCMGAQMEVNIWRRDYKSDPLAADVLPIGYINGAK